MENITQFTSTLPALRIIENEHHLLTYLMNEWHAIVLGFERNQYSEEEVLPALELLRSKMLDFKAVYTKHAQKEETYLFAMLIKYVGNEQGPVNAIGGEHEEIDTYIDHFLHHTDGDLSKLTFEQMKQLSQDAGEVYEVITFHFVKEESVIFPMVEDILKANEQYELFEKMYSTII